MTRTYFESYIFDSSHQAYKMMRQLRTKHRIYCKIVQLEGERPCRYERKKCMLTCTSVIDEKTQLLKELGFTPIKEETL